MDKRISNQGSNEFGAWANYTDGSSIAYIVSMNVTIITNEFGEEIRVEGRQGI